MDEFQRPAFGRCQTVFIFSVREVSFKPFWLGATDNRIIQGREELFGQR